MKTNEIISWIKTEFKPVSLATPDNTLEQVVQNTIRYFNTHSAYKIVRMYDTSNLQIKNERVASGDGSTLHFEFSFIQGPVKAGSVSISCSVGANVVTIVDDSVGNLSGTNVTGTISYSAKTVSLDFDLGYAPNSGSSFTADYGYSGSSTRIPIDSDIKIITKVYPASAPQLLWQDNSLWKLFGMTIIDNVTSDLIMMTEAFKNYQLYVGTDFRWTFEPSKHEDEMGYLYVQNMNSSNTQFCVVGAKRVLRNEDIQGDHLLDWILSYAKSLTKIIEGNTLRKSSIIGIANDGQSLVDEGKEEKKSLEDRLALEGRWLALAHRW